MRCVRAPIPSSNRRASPALRPYEEAGDDENRGKPDRMGPEMVVGQGGKHVPGERFVEEIRDQAAHGGEAEVEREPAGGEEALAHFHGSDADGRVRDGKHHPFQRRYRLRRYDEDGLSSTDRERISEYAGLAANQLNSVRFEALSGSDSELRTRTLA